MQTLDELGYDVADAEDNGPDDPKIIDGKHFLPQHRERIVLVGFRRDLNLKADFTLRDISKCFPAQRVTLAQLLDPMVEAKYILTPVLWKYLYRYAKKHQARGNGFGYGMVYPNNPQSVTRTLSARYYKDGAEILIDRGWDMATGEKDFDDPLNQQHRPRRLTPRECARLMGFEAPGEAKFRIPVSDTQAYRQFGNSVVVPVFAAVANCLSQKSNRRWRCVSKRHNMVDVHDKATRSKNMRAIATRDTAIEKRLASLLTGQGLAFRVQDASLPGRPDFVLDEFRCVIFAHGCFWHHHHCYLFKVPATRTDFWLEKIGKNVERDRRDISHLQELGWRVLIVWECALRGREKLTDAALTERLEEWICGEGASAQIDTQGIHLLA